MGVKFPWPVRAKPVVCRTGASILATQFKVPIQKDKMLLRLLAIECSLPITLWCMAS
jgi:hypothetical protein